LARLLKSSKQPDAAAVRTSTVKLEHDCEPVRKRIKIEQDVATAGDQECSRSSSSSSSDVWVKCDKYVLKNEDREIIERGRELTDKQIQYSQYLTKKQFLTIGDLHSTLLQSRQKSKLPENSLQVAHCGARHHSFKHTVDCKNRVDDSLFTSLDEETLATVHGYFSEQGSKCKAQGRMREVQKQNGTKDCGVFAVAFLTSSVLPGSAKKTFE